MENSIEKLKCLNYEISFVKNVQQKIVSQDEFTIPAANTALQFNHYVGLLKWLISIVQGGQSLDVDEYDDPNIIAQKIMLKLRSLDFEVNFPIAKLKQPYGEVACSILDFLTNKALEVQGFRFSEPKYENNPEKKEGSNELGYVDDDTMHNACEESGDITDFYADADFSRDNECVRIDDTADTVIEPNIDPIEWRTELERVGPSLQAHIKKKQDNDWKGHIDQANSESKKVELELHASREVFTRLQNDSMIVLEQIHAKEQIINDRLQYLSNQCSSLYGKTRECEKACAESSATVTKLSTELSRITHLLNETKESVDEKGNSMTDTTPLIMLKTNLQLIKADIRDYDLQIGLLERTLLQKRIQERNTRDTPGEDLNQSFEASFYNSS